MLATQVILCVTIVGNAALFWVALKERSSPIRTTFLVYVACIAGWAFTIFINLFFQSLLVEDWIFATAAGMLTAQVWFAHLFPIEKTRTIDEYWSIAIGLFFVAVSFYPGALFTSIAIHPEGHTTLDTGPLSTFYSLFALIYALAPLVIFFLKYWKEKNDNLRKQLRQLTTGSALFTGVAVFTNSVLPVFFHIYSFNAIGPSFSLVFASAALYIIGTRGVEQKITERTEWLRTTHERERHMMLEIAHGLQTPLAVAKTKIESLRERVDANDVHMIERSFDALSDFVSGLLHLAHLEHTQVIQLDDIDLSDLMRDICDETEVVAETDGVRTIREIEANIFVRANMHELRLAVMNVISNSIKYIGEDGPKEIRIQLMCSGSDAILSIEDSGIGITPQDLARIFERFYRTHSSEKTGGGLGLAITKVAIERHGGTIQAESRLGKGTKLTIRLPLVRQRGELA